MLCPFADILLISANTGGPMADIRGFAAHSQVGYGSLFTTFNNPDRRASTHFWISQTGHLEQYVDTDRQAWAHANGNPYYWSSEFEGMSYNDGPQEMDGDPFTPAQLDKAGELIVWLHDLSPFPVIENTIPGVDGYGVSAHRRITEGTKWATACPGRLRLAQFPELVLATLRHLDETPPEVEVTAPAYEYDSNGTLWVAGLGKGTDKIYVKRISIDPDFGPLNGSATSSPTLSAGPGGVMTVGARGADGAAWRNTFTPKGKPSEWSGWVSDGGQLA